ncbi:cAMP-responsive element-binding protein-like 2 isoform X1 [Catharus ustulatus]|uniref:cAMP-responsive element-binding protein-like 2 n=1 Tax=Catharus ustulatus TaxID=91951 RepID=A0A8C3THA2_CATUS|nr:cAMP-responsive element-binding protein-like 2 isoform X1 [Catharus ustulatus]
MDDSKVVGGKVKKPGKRGRKPAKIDLKAKLERSRQSARECRARKKLRYQYLEELVSSRERAICALREELEMYKQWCMAMDQGKIPSEIKALLTGEEQGKAQQNSTKLAKAAKTEANSSNPCPLLYLTDPCSPSSCFPLPPQTLPYLSTDHTQPSWVKNISKLVSTRQEEGLEWG